MEGVDQRRCPGDDRSHSSTPRLSAGSSAHGRRKALGVVSGDAAATARMCVVHAVVQHLCGGYRGDFNVRFSEDETYLKERQIWPMKH